MPQSDHEVVVGDLADPTIAERVVEGCAGVVHLAAASRTSASWDEVLHDNISATYQLLEACRRAGVRRFVFASSNHVTGLLDDDRAWPIGPASPIAPDSLYGASKVFGEALARLYAARGISVICLRIGWMLDEAFNEKSVRLFISPRDLAHLIDRSLATRTWFGIYYGVSNNVPLRYDISNTAADLGYRPLDGAHEDDLAD
jgi:NAD+ dependent glucose-6-phosphate dehydrogenase